MENNETTSGEKVKDVPHLKWRIAYKSNTGAEGHGEYCLPLAEAEEACRRANDVCAPNIEHWPEPNI